MTLVWSPARRWGHVHTTPHSSRGALRRTIQIALLAVALPGHRNEHDSTVAGFSVDGADAQLKPSKKPAIEAAFPHESYRLSGRAARDLLEAGTERVRAVLPCGHGTSRHGSRGRDVRDGRHGRQVSRARCEGPGRSPFRSQTPSGLYFAKLTGSGNRVGYAPFVLRPRRIGENRVAVVLPTLAWQAYNFHDDNGDGQADTWYASPKVKSVLLGRPFDQRGVPPNYKYYEQPFLRWLIANEKDVDYLAQSDVAAANGRKLASSYNLLIFSGHHEYVTDREYDASSASAIAAEPDVPLREQLLRRTVISHNPYPRRQVA